MIKVAFRYTAIVTKHIDGDTFWAMVDLGFRVHAGLKIRIRQLKAPELNTDDGIAAARKLRAVLPLATPVVLESHGKDGDASYDRWVCDVELGGQDIKLLL